MSTAGTSAAPPAGVRGQAGGVSGDAGWRWRSRVVGAHGGVEEDAAGPAHARGLSAEDPAFAGQMATVWFKKVRMTDRMFA